MEKYGSDKPDTRYDLIIKFGASSSPPNRLTLHHLLIASLFITS
jgi:hypothetical protein